MFCNVAGCKQTEVGPLALMPLLQKRAKITVAGDCGSFKTSRACTLALQLAFAAVEVSEVFKSTTNNASCNCDSARCAAIRKASQCSAQ